MQETLAFATFTAEIARMCQTSMSNKTFSTAKHDTGKKVPSSKGHSATRFTSKFDTSMHQTSREINMRFNTGSPSRSAIQAAGHPVNPNVSAIGFPSNSPFFSFNSPTSQWAHTSFPARNFASSEVSQTMKLAGSNTTAFSSADTLPTLLVTPTQKILYKKGKGKEEGRKKRTGERKTHCHHLAY